jgi:hypothetical protein
VLKYISKGFDAVVPGTRRDCFLPIPQTWPEARAEMRKLSGERNAWRGLFVAEAFVLLDRARPQRDHKNWRGRQYMRALRRALRFGQPPPARPPATPAEAADAAAAAKAARSAPLTRREVSRVAGYGSWALADYEETLSLVGIIASAMRAFEGMKKWYKNDAVVAPKPREWLTAESHYARNKSKYEPPRATHDPPKQTLTQTLPPPKP